MEDLSDSSSGLDQWCRETPHPTARMYTVRAVLDFVEQVPALTPADACDFAEDVAWETSASTEVVSESSLSWEDAIEGELATWQQAREAYDSSRKNS